MGQDAGDVASFIVGGAVAIGSAAGGALAAVATGGTSAVGGLFLAAEAASTAVQGGKNLITQKDRVYSEGSSDNTRNDASTNNSSNTNKSLQVGLERQVKDTGASMKASGKAPSLVVGGQLPNGDKAIKASGPPPLLINPKLKAAANKIGGVGTVRNGNKIGCCGEFQVANELLSRNPQSKPSDIKFTPAIRPRTGQQVPMCQNCRDMFGGQ